MSNVALNNDICSHGFFQASCTTCNLKGLCLPMSRMDIGNFLGLTIETVSRTFSRLQKKYGIIGVDGRQVVINNHERLHEICHKSR